MRLAIISDIHSNYWALEKVLDDIDKQKIDKIICLGDLIGYGPLPNKTLNLVRESVDICLQGNHDNVYNEKSLMFFKNMFMDVSAISYLDISNKNKEYLKSLPLYYNQDNLKAVHASFNDPLWEFVSSLEQAADIFLNYNEKVFLTGHTHQALFMGLFNEDNQDKVIKENVEFDFKLDYSKYKKILFNPGSVGNTVDNYTNYLILDLDKSLTNWRYLNYDKKEYKKTLSKVFEELYYFSGR